MQSSESKGDRADARDLRAQIEHLREELARAGDAVRLRDEFIGLLGHQLRNSMAPLVMAVELLEQQISEAPDRLSLSDLQLRLRVLTDGLQPFVALLNRVFDTAALDKGDLVLRAERVDLAEEVETWIARHQRELGAAGCELTCDVDHSAIGTWDRARVDQIIDSLLANAVRYGSGHPIEVRVRREGDDGILVVQDHGIGIDHAEQKRVFERYVRGSCGRRASGLGLGLWIVHELCHAMAGEVSLDSEVGRGSTFSVRLPLVPRA